MFVARAAHAFVWRSAKFTAEEIQILFSISIEAEVHPELGQVGPIFLSHWVEHRLICMLVSGGDEDFALSDVAAERLVVGQCDKDDTWRNETCPVIDGMRHLCRVKGRIRGQLHRCGGCALPLRDGGMVTPSQSLA
jgi:hypothetical protein